MSRVATTDTATGRRVDVTVAGTRTAYWEYGDPALPTLVAVHGLRGTHHGLVPLVAQLHGHRVVVPDLPGFGASAPMAWSHDVDGYARWLAGLLDAVRPAEGTVLLGHSFGSVLAAATVAGGAPVGALVLVNPITAPPSNRVRRAGTGLAVLAHRAAAGLPERVGGAVLRTRVLTELMRRTRSCGDGSDASTAGTSGRSRVPGSCSRRSRRRRTATSTRSLRGSGSRRSSWPAAGTLSPRSATSGSWPPASRTRSSP
jgi:pimeloyl-ACP methyl ester carboxylesterase